MLADMRSADMRSYLKRRYDTQRAFFIELMGGQCAKCKSTIGLQIDHIKPSEKELELSQLFSKRTIVAAMIELTTKCQILCERHHREKSAAECAARAPSFKHGTLYGWMKRKCSCLACSIAKRSWHDERNKRRRASSE
jgi:5-methylcytosine-specific restriction endonuclease McrA